MTDEIMVPFQILNKPWENIEYNVMAEIQAKFPEITAKTLFIVPTKGINQLKIPLKQVTGVVVELVLKPLEIHNNVSVDYSAMFDFCLIRKDA